MKIDKVLWSSSVEFSDFWNVNSMIHNKFLGLECILLLHGKRDQCDVSEKYGKVIEFEFGEGRNALSELCFNKFHYTQNEPETTWLVGDMDQIPLQQNHFINLVKDVPEDFYVHLAEDAICSLGEKDWKKERGALVGHYHVAKGKVFKEALSLSNSLQSDVAKMLDKADKDNMKIWAFEEFHTADLIKENNYLDKFTGFSRPHVRKICRSHGCRFDPDTDYVDIHCPRPFSSHKEQIHAILKTFWEDFDENY